MDSGLPDMENAVCGHWEGRIQGSIIGPLLYAIFTNELTEAVKVPSCVHPSHTDTSRLFGQQCEECGILSVFADNSTYTIGHRRRQDNYSSIMRALDELVCIIQDNQLSINEAKTGLSECMLKQKRCKTPGAPTALLSRVRMVRKW